MRKTVSSNSVREVSSFSGDDDDSQGEVEERLSIKYVNSASSFSS